MANTVDLEKLAAELEHCAWQSEATATVGRTNKEKRAHWRGRADAFRQTAREIRSIADGTAPPALFPSVARKT